MAGPTDTSMAAVGISSARARVLNRLRSRAEPWGIVELAADLKLHRNTVRGHLTALVEDGLAEYSDPRSARPGRPARVYRATSLGEGITYPTLVAALAETIGGLPDPEEVARQTGQRWGCRLVSSLRRRRPDADLSDDLAELGFEPRPIPDVGYELRSCPMLVAARRNAEIVCQVYAGMVQTLAQAHLEPATVDLEPMASPSGCLVRLHPATRPPRQN